MVYAERKTPSCSMFQRGGRDVLVYASVLCLAKIDYNEEDAKEKERERKKEKECTMMAIDSNRILFHAIADVML